MDNCMAYGTWMVAKRKPWKVVKMLDSNVDHVSTSFKGLGTENRGVPKSSGLSKLINQDLGLNTVIDLELLMWRREVRRKSLYWWLQILKVFLLIKMALWHQLLWRQLPSHWERASLLILSLF
ncbi:hypothetical protein SLA2020_051440 [Shorea laevis]